MIIIVKKTETHFINDKEFEKISHYRDKKEVKCTRKSDGYDEYFCGVEKVWYVAEGYQNDVES